MTSELNRHRRRALLISALVLAGAVAGGMTAMLGGFMAVLLLLDATAHRCSCGFRMTDMLCR